jgi:hypothetical protein
VQELALDLERHDVEEDRHQQVVDDVTQVELELQRYEPQRVLGRPEGVVGIAIDVGPRERRQRRHQEQHPAARLEAEEPLQRPDHEPGHRTLRARPRSGELPRRLDSRPAFSHAS